MDSTGTGVDLETSVGYRLKRASTVLGSAMEAVLRPLGLTITQYSTLEHLAQSSGLSGAALARATFVTRQSMGLALQALVADGLITRADAATRGRELPVELTAAGRRRLSSASLAVRGVEERMLAGLDPGDAAALGRLLDRCIDSLR